MKRKNPAQPGLFDALEFPLLFAPEQAENESDDKSSGDARQAPALESCLDPIPATDNGRDWGDFDSCLDQFGTNICTLDGEPARIIGTPRTREFASIEPVYVDVDPIRCCWDVVDMVMSTHREFFRSDDDTDD